MVSRRILYCLAASCAWAPALAQEPLAPGQAAAAAIRAVQAPQERDSTLLLLGHARDAFDLRSAGQAYDLQVSFTVNSSGQTRYDGEWQMEDMFVPQQGLRWTATLPGQYSITRISSHSALYGEESASYVPLRLHEARAALFDPVPPAQSLAHASIRRASASYQGEQVTCLLFSTTANSSAARAWNETEDCIDPESGWLRIHSPVPGRYYTYDYSNAFQLGTHLVPRKVTIYEGGAPVTQISVNAMNQPSSLDAALFQPTAAMQANGRPITLGPAQKLLRVSRAKPGSPAGTVCIFGLVTASGELVEAHSLQPSNPASQAALEAAQKMSFSRPPGAAPQQYFVFILFRFVPSP